jgi:transposase
MYIKITKNQKGEAYHHLVESYREGGKVRQRTLLSLGRVEDGKLEELAAAIAKHTDLIAAANLAKQVDVKDAYILGPLLVLERMMDALGINKLLSNIQKSHPKSGLDIGRLMFTMMASRFVQPVSKLALFDRQIGRLYPEMVDHDTQLHHLYRVLDIMAGHKEEAERFLFYHKKDLFNVGVDVVLYDLTTLRFESTKNEPESLRQFGYSKEMRSDCTQVVLGLLTDTDAIPLGFEVYPGNTFEGRTLEGIVEKMRKKFTVNRFVFIADRGLFSWGNLEHLRKDGGEFIVGMKMGTLAKPEQQDLYDLSKFKFLNEEIAVMETTVRGERCIVTWSKSRAERDRKAREEVLAKMRAKLAGAKPTKKFISHASHKKYLVIDESKPPTINQQAVEHDAAKDGFFAVVTNVKSMTATEVVSHYKQLWKIEDSFGELKGTLKARPVYHWTDERIVGHLMVCFLAYLCEAHMTKALRSQQAKIESKAADKKSIKTRQLTAAMAMEELASVMAIPVEIGQKRIWVRTDIPPNATSLFKALKMKIPPKIMTPPT